jgi:hypothetical protein
MITKLQVYIFCILFAIIFTLTITLGTGCSNYTTKHLGGTMNVELEQNKKLVNITWKQDEMWILVRDRKENESVDSYQFYEK